MIGAALTPPGRTRVPASRQPRLQRATSSLVSTTASSALLFRVGRRRGRPRARSGAVPFAQEAAQEQDDLGVVRRELADGGFGVPLTDGFEEHAVVVRRV